MEDGVGPGEGGHQRVEVVDVGGDVADVGAVRGPQVDDMDIVAGGHEPVHHVRADEASAAGHQESHVRTNPTPRSALEPGRRTTVPERER